MSRKHNFDTDDADKQKQEISAKRETYFERISNFQALKNGLIKKYVENALDLRDRQQKSIFKITDTPQGDYTYSSGYFNACTAFGKTYLLMAMAEGYHAEEPDKKIVILEETTDVLEQIAEDLTEKSSFGLNDIGVYYKEEKTPQAPIVVCTYTSMKKMVGEVGKENIGLVLCDEAHHGLSKERQNFIRQTFAGACLYGFTGTPEYNAAKTCRDLFETEIDSIDIKEGVDSGLLCSVKNGLMISKIPMDLTGIKDNTGDYDDKKLMEAISKLSHKKGIRESLAEYYITGYDEDIGILKGKTTLINVPNKEEADKLAEVFNEKAGSTIARAYHEETGKEPLIGFNKGEFPVLIQVRRLSEGYNNPKIELCINYPTASQVREAQCSGRALRRDSENPNKMALVIDIAFKKENGGDVYDQIARNGQVLFKDIAQDVCFLSPIRLKMHQHRRELTYQSENKQKIGDDMLFDVVTSYEELYTLTSKNKEFTEQSFVPHRQNNDICADEFRYKCDVYRSDGSKVSRLDRKKLFLELMNNENLLNAGIMAKRRDYAGKKREFIIGDKLAELQKMTGLRIVLRSKDTLPEQMLDTDIGSLAFRVKYHLYRSDGTEIGSNNKVKIFGELTKNQELIDAGIVVYKRANNDKLYPCIPAEKIAEFQQKTGYILTAKEDNSKIQYRDKNDIGNFDFINKNHVYHPNGHELTEIEKSALFDELVQNQELINAGIIADRKSFGGKIYPFILKDKLTALQEMTGYHISKTSLIAERQANDICYDDFRQKFFAYREDGTSLSIKEKEQFFHDKKLADAGFIAIRKDSIGRRHPYIIGDKLDELKEHTGYTIKSAKTVYFELEAQAAATLIPEERNKYLTQARKLFEKLNPQIKKQQICPQCLLKIKSTQNSL
ncbi:MAG: DEAD/DEAH box helicase family protein [Alphaproteobacteria bacterium]|nr:DEAD/DEAH box helicase family protein [Alphaproteobacteria bacterium]